MTVYQILNRQLEEGHVRPHPIPGRTKSTTEQQDEALGQLIRENGFRTAIQAKVQLELPFSQSTIRRRWHESGYHHRIPARYELLTMQHKEQRMGFALEHMNWNDEWMSTIFTDEKVFSTDESRRVSLWRVNGTRYKDENICFRQRSGRITLAFWGCMSSRGVGPLVRTTPHMDSAEYIDILSNAMLPHIRETFLGMPVNFVHDNSGVHRARMVQDWLATQPNITTLNWPAKSPDMNVIENLWGIIVQEWNPLVRRTREALEQHVMDIWEGLRARPELLQNLVASMPQRLDAVIENQGSVTRY